MTRPSRWLRIRPNLHQVSRIGSDELYPWRGANAGNLDLLGNRKPAAHLRNIVWNRGEKLYLAVRQPEDGKGK